MGTRKVSGIKRFKQYTRREYRKYRELEFLQQVGIWIVVMMFVVLVIYIVSVAYREHILKEEAMIICSTIYSEYDIFNAVIDKGGLFLTDKVYDKYISVTCDGVFEHSIRHENFYIEEKEFDYLIKTGDFSGVCR